MQTMMIQIGRDLVDSLSRPRVKFSNSVKQQCRPQQVNFRMQFPYVSCYLGRVGLWSAYMYLHWYILYARRLIFRTHFTYSVSLEIRK